MIPADYVTQWRQRAPWIQDSQVEQDLLLSRALVEMFQRDTVADTLALRGGTALNKLHLAPAARYSEDIDLVQVVAGPIGPALDAARSALDPWLGKPRRSLLSAGLARAYQSNRAGYELNAESPLRTGISSTTAWATISRSKGSR